MVVDNRPKADVQTQNRNFGCGPPGSDQARIASATPKLVLDKPQDLPPKGGITGASWEVRHSVRGTHASGVFDSVSRGVSCLAMLAGSAAAGIAPETSYPVVEEPVLRPTRYSKRPTYGYKLKSLELPPSPHPTIFTMEGYSGASRPAPNVYLRMDDGELMALRITFGAGPRGDYASVQASTRGTECSGGSFNLYDRRHAWDGYHIIEWIAEQDVVERQRRRVRFVVPRTDRLLRRHDAAPASEGGSANLLHSDIYRDIFMPGGVQNYLFPTLWTYAAGPHRLPQDSVTDGISRTTRSARNCRPRATASAMSRRPQNEPLFAAVRAVDDDWYAAHAAITYAPSIKIPYYQQTNWQDEQVGPALCRAVQSHQPDTAWITDTNGEQELRSCRRSSSRRTAIMDTAIRRPRAVGFLRHLPARACRTSTGLLDHKMTNYFEAEGDGTAVAHEVGQRVAVRGHGLREVVSARRTASLSTTPPTAAEPRRVRLGGRASELVRLRARELRQRDHAPLAGSPTSSRYTSPPLDGEQNDRRADHDEPRSVDWPGPMPTSTCRSRTCSPTDACRSCSAACSRRRIGGSTRGARTTRPTARPWCSPTGRTRTRSR